MGALVVFGVLFGWLFGRGGEVLLEFLSGRVLFGGVLGLF